MKDIWLDTHEFDSDSITAAKLDKLEFPYTYPLVNHPSTIFLMKGQKEFLNAEFTLNNKCLSFNVTMGNIEAIITLQ